MRRRVYPAKRTNGRPETEEEGVSEGRSRFAGDIERLKGNTGKLVPSPKETSRMYSKGDRWKLCL